MKLYRAIIEDNVNPNKNGRVRVRIFGIHTKNNENSSDNFNTVASKDLPWAEVIISSDNNLNTGIGLSSIPKQGTMVWVILENDDANYPIVIGSISGVPTKSSEGLYKSGEGFCDPDGVYPFDDRLDEPDINRLTRVEELDKTIHKKIIDAKDTVNKNDSKSGANVSQEEPDSTNDKTAYPYNRVLETESGHIIELDDTKNNERVRVYHKSGSYIEIKPDGSFVQKSVGDENHYIHYGDVQEHIKKSVKSYIENNMDVIIEGYVKRAIKGTYNEHISGLMTIDADGKLLINGEVKINGGGLEVTGKVSSGGGVTTSGEVADSTGNLSSLRDSYDSHTHLYKIPEHVAGEGPSSIPTETDPVSRDTDYIW